ncbi:MAG: hypothetical protein CL878_02005 [Dehalococcoidia bacterium]|nr:hypothetical protein [Dehalococcoidia bacterium]
MAKELQRVSLEEFSKDVLAIIERIDAEGESVVVERRGKDVAVVNAAPTKNAARPRRQKTEADYAAFLAAAGGWKDVDTEQLKSDIAESRRLSSRPSVKL